MPDSVDEAISELDSAATVDAAIAIAKRIVPTLNSVQVQGIAQADGLALTRSAKSPLGTPITVRIGFKTMDGLPTVRYSDCDVTLTIGNRAEDEPITRPLAAVIVGLWLGTNKGRHHSIRPDLSAKKLGISEEHLRNLIGESD